MVLCRYGSSESSQTRSALCARVSRSPEIADPVGALEVGKHEDVEEFGAGSGAESVQAVPESAL